MNHERGRELLRDERARVESLLAARALTQLEERSFESDSIDPSEAAEPLTAQGIDDAARPLCSATASPRRSR